MVDAHAIVGRSPRIGMQEKTISQRFVIYILKVFSVAA